MNCVVFTDTTNSLIFLNEKLHTKFDNIEKLITEETFTILKSECKEITKFKIDEFSLITNYFKNSSNPNIDKLLNGNISSVEILSDGIDLNDIGNFKTYSCKPFILNVGSFNKDKSCFNDNRIFLVFNHKSNNDINFMVQWDSNLLTEEIFNNIINLLHKQSIDKYN
jgi:hypothetical protein